MRNELGEKRLVDFTQESVQRGGPRVARGMLAGGSPASTQNSGCRSSGEGRERGGGATYQEPVEFVGKSAPPFGPASSRWVVLLGGPGRHRLPAGLLVPVHVVEYVAHLQVLPTAPDASVPLHPVPESPLPHLMVFRKNTKERLSWRWGKNPWRRMPDRVFGRELASEEKPRNASCMEENSMTFTPLWGDNSCTS